jgi:predicted MFS family arabinose efflux permease
VLSLHARPLAVSLLFGVSYAVQAATAPFSGVLADSVRSLRRLLVTVDAAQALVIVAVPVSRAFSALTVPLLFAVAALSGGLGGVTDITIRAVASRCLPAADFVSGNSALSGARTLGQLSGPALAGWLIQALGATTAVAADALSYLASGLICLRLPAADGHPGRPGQPGQPGDAGRPRGRPSLREGLSVLRGRPALVRIAIAGAALNLGGAALGALYVLYAYRSLRLSPAALGMILVVQNGAAVLAAVTAARVARRIGLERVVPLFAPVAAAALFLIPAASLLSPLSPLLTLSVYAVIFGYCTTVWTIGSASLQQVIVPPSQIGRVAALSGSVSLVVIPVGAVAGGLLANTLGLRPTLLLAAFAALAGTLAVAGRSLSQRTQPR